MSRSNRLAAASALAVALVLTGMSPAHAAAKPEAVKPSNPKEVVGHVSRTEAEWRKQLSPAAFNVLRQKGTEFAFTGKYWNNHEAGLYRCAGCGLSLFRSDTKFDSGTGWPSFWAPIDPTHVRIAADNSLGMERDEVVCARCGGHLGHVFDDGPEPTGKRFCMNSVSLTFEKGK